MSRDSRTRTRGGRSNKFFFYLVMMIVLLIVLIALIGVMLYQSWSENQKEEVFNDLRTEAATEEAPIEVVAVTEASTEVQGTEETVTVTMTISIPQLGLDWDSIMAQNDDIYAWIYIPNTNVDYPVLQHPTDDTYYLNYNLDGSKGYPGCIYSEMSNSKEFTDSLTVLYGHNMKNGSMFRTLHYFEEEDFFNENEYAYVYLPDGEVLVYDIFSAGAYTDTHIINSFGTDKVGLYKFLNDFEDNLVMSTHTRDGINVDYRTDRVLVLSTCISGQSSKRYLVQGVVVYDGVPTGDTVEVEVDDTSSTETATEPGEAVE